MQLYTKLNFSYSICIVHPLKGTVNEQLAEKSELTKKFSNDEIILVGDFNLLNIHWEIGTVPFNPHNWKIISQNFFMDHFCFFCFAQFYKNFVACG